MIAVIFEVKPKSGCQAQYLDIAASLKPLLADAKGLISIERFQSLTDPEKILSLSFWESEEAVTNWRNTELHRLAQKQGRESIFAYYQLSVANVIRQYGLTDRQQTPTDSLAYHAENKNTK